MNILAIESSCDETAAAVVKDGVKILGSAVASSTAMHEKYGGIVPEVAAREQLNCILPVIKEALEQSKLKLEDIDSLAVTVGPGLIGSLLIGVETAKTLALSTNKQIIPVNHVLAHMYANFVDGSQFTVHSKTNTDVNQPRTMNHEQILFPAISLVVSGGHTELFLMKSPKDLTWLGGTLDDAAGEAFDKTARLLGFGSRGGVAIQESALKLTELGIRNYELGIKLPRPMISDKSLNFSFSGLKTAILREVNKLKESNQLDTVAINHFAYEVQEAITDVLVSKTLDAVKLHDAKSILVSGGVAANLRLRKKFAMKLHSNGTSKLSLHIPPISLCTDNAAYIGAYAFFRGKSVKWEDITAIPDLSVENV